MRCKHSLLLGLGGVLGLLGGLDLSGQGLGGLGDGGGVLLLGQLGGGGVLGGGDLGVLGGGEGFMVIIRILALRLMARRHITTSVKVFIL